ncbi:MAG: hypothetical protein PHC62_02355 [Candidatus Izemoplasmatales bacterium]|jgi:predicted nucleotidyltransferase|nr:hypothetical protein [Candidatus Izemoplasmatales bacterium]
MDSIQIEYREQVTHMVNFINTIFKEKVISIYLSGSVWSNEAILYHSDVDLFLVLTDYVDKEEIKKTFLKKLIEEYPFSPEPHISIYSLQQLKTDHFTRFIMEYNCGLMYGNNIAKDLNKVIDKTINPSEKAYFQRLQFAKDAYEALKNGKRNLPNLGLLPSDTYFAARKLIKYFIVIEGAYYLMKVGNFKSFNTDEVFNSLENLQIINQNEKNLYKFVLTNPQESKVTEMDALKIIKDKIGIFLSEK